MNKLRIELNKRYFNNIPESAERILDKINYILEKINLWKTNDISSNNIEVDIILDSFNLQLKGIDIEFEK